VNSVSLAVVILIAFAIFGGTAVFFTGKKSGFTSFRALVILTYTTLYIVSGIVHLLRSTDLGRRGLYDVPAELDPAQIDKVALIASCGLLALVFGTFLGTPSSSIRKRRPATLNRFDRSMVPIMVIALAPLVLWANLEIRRYVAGVDLYGGRVVTVSGGFARYAVVANWAVWLVSLGVIWLLCRGQTKRPMAIAGTFLAGLAVIAIAVSWSGGRSVTLISALPMALVLLPLVRLPKSVIVGLSAAVAAGFYFWTGYLTTKRFAESRSTSGLVEWLDWELGRFSMLGWATRYSDQNGFIYGETLVNSSLRFLSGFQKILGIAPGEITQRSSQRIATEEFARSSAGTTDFVNPSLIAEMYLNFGAVGVIFVCLFLGYLCGYVDGRFNSSKTALIQLLWAYFGTLVAVQSLFSDSIVVFANLVWNGTPLLAAALLSSLAYQISGATKPSPPQGGRRAADRLPSPEDRNAAASGPTQPSDLILRSH
jgi:oligosaccharide repeat unit polymerase